MATDKTRPSLRKSRKWLCLIAACLVLLLGYWLVTTSILGLQSAKQLSQLTSVCSDLQFEPCINSLEATSVDVSRLEQQLSFLKPLPYFKEIVATVSVGQNNLEAVHAFLESLETTLGIYESGETPKLTRLLELQRQFADILVQSQELYSTIENPRLAKIATWLGQAKRYEETLHKLRQLQPILESTSDLIPVLPSTLGFEEPQHYLVLFQNNMELRPTGGFIGSYASLTLDKGRLSHFSIQDIYVPDGQIKGYVPEPPAIRQYLFDNDHPGWRLRDSNWNPHFPTAAKDMRWFFEQGKLESIDGMAAINLHLIDEVLELLQPVHIPDYDLTVTSDNFYQLAQAYSEMGFFPGSTQKRDFLNAVGQELVRQLLSQPQAYAIDLAGIALQQLDSQQILLEHQDPEITQALMDKQWTGSFTTGECPDSRSCLSDYLYINEANLGSNKANCCIQRQFEDTISLSPNSVDHTVSLSFTNTNPAEPQPPHFWGGGYKNYVRIIAPEGARLHQITLDDELISTEMIETEKIADKTSFGFLILIEGGQSRTATITYTLPYTQGHNLNHYQLTLQRQPGVTQIPWEISLTGSIGQPTQDRKIDLNKTQTLTWALDTP